MTPHQEDQCPLLPCPFCGGEAAADRNPSANGGFISDMVVCQNDQCLTATRFYETDREAIAAWNRRADITAARQGGGEPVAEAMDALRPLGWRTEENLRAAAVNALADTAPSLPGDGGRGE